MSDSYDNYLKAKQDYANRNKDVLDIVNKTKDIPQNILWAKTANDFLRDDEARFETVGDKYYFTEPLVNKLMYFAFLMGQKGFEEKSFSEGWNACLKDVADRLGMVIED